MRSCDERGLGDAIRPVHRPDGTGSLGGRWRVRVALLAVAGCLAAAPAHGQSAARALYEQALERERTVRAAPNPRLEAIRAAVQAYERVVRRYPRSGYCDNALWQGAGLELLAYERYRDDADRRNGERLLRLIRSEYPASSFVARVDEHLKRFAAAVSPPAAAASPPAATSPAPQATSKPAPPPAPAPEPVKPPPVAEPPAAAQAPALASPATGPVIRRISRQKLPQGVRVIIEVDSEAQYQEGRLPEPPRVFFDFKGVGISPALDREALGTPDEIVKAIRLGPRPDGGTRVVFELAAEQRYTVFTLYDPYRLVVDFEQKQAPGGPDAPVAVTEPAPLSAKPPAPPASQPPAAPSRNADGTFSLARQLGLGISRVVVDPGHGGHDPGARAGNVTEADLVLDIARRLEALLLKQPGVEVVMTRRTDVFVPLEERTAVANREGADLFLSIHANASRNRRANGVETYYLNFATNPDAEAVAARENSASGRTMRSLPEIVQAIALNNKLDESRDLARMVQDAMIKRLKPQHRSVRSLGVKQAPFVVLIGAGMPSVLAEVSFLTNKTEISLLRKPAYRQRIAQALADAVMRYQRSLKTPVAVAQRPAPEAAKRD